MPGETDLHKTLKKEACHWLFRMGYRAIAAEVRLPPLGIIDAVGTGLFRPYHNYLYVPYDVTQVCFVECKASRSDYLRDIGGDGQLQMFLHDRKSRNGRRGRKPSIRRLAKFDGCVVHSLANLLYVLAPAGVIQKKDLPPRWGLLSFGPAGVSVVVKAQWLETAADRSQFVDGAIARTLTGDIYRADDRAINSVNRQLMARQAALADRIRSIRPRAVFAPPMGRDLPQQESYHAASHAADQLQHP
ncbi:MAG TPA: hypothetical protein VL992_02245 [Tepidisphaeraceae bacterium]|nr:hypothetical protein [Tepidisphaeraceae bacterium]